MWTISADNPELTFPGEGDYTIDWGDSTSVETVSFTAGDSYPTHPYRSGGDYTVRTSKTITRFNLAAQRIQREKLKEVKQWGAARWTSMKNAFSGASMMTMTAGDEPVLTGVTEMGGMFRDAILFNGDISGWDVSRVTDMGSMFIRANAFNQDISSWDVSSVTDMASMFDDAAMFNQNLGPWYVTSTSSLVSSPTPMITAQNTVLREQSPAYTLVAGDGDGGNQFFMLSGSTLIPNTGTADGAYTVRVSATGELFGIANSASVSINLGAPDPTADFVTTWQMPPGDLTLTFPGSDDYVINWGDGTIEAATGSISHTYTSAGEKTVRVSKGITHFNLNNVGDKEKLIDVAQWGTADWTSMQGAFYGAINMRMSATDTPNLGSVTSMQDMFRSASVFNADISGWNVSSVESMQAMFTGASVFNADISGWDVSSVESMWAMFASTNVFNQNIGGWNVSSVTNMLQMFSNARAFNQDISNWDVSSVTDMTSMFALTRDFSQNLGRWYVIATEPTATPTLAAQNEELNDQDKNYALVDGDGGTDNGLFSITTAGVLSLNTPDPTPRTYSLRISIDAAPAGEGVVPTFGTNNEVAIIVTSTGAVDSRLYAISFPLNLGPTAEEKAEAEEVAAAEEQVLNAVLPQLLRATTKIAVDNISDRIDQALDASASTDTSLNLGGSSTLQELINNNAHTALQDGLDIKQMLSNSSFRIPLNVAGDNNYGANNMTLWGSGDYLNLSDDASGVDWEGEIVGGSVGIDARLSRNLVAGAAVSYSEGDIDYKRDDENDSANNSKGTLTNTLTSVHPYLGYDLSQSGRVWGTFGYGQGEVEISEQGTSTDETSSRDTELYSLAFGGSGDLLSSNSWLNLSGTTTLRLKGEVSLSNIKVDKNNLTGAKALSIDAHRYRIALEGNHKQTLASGASISPSIELGILYDDGSGDETGGGVELAGSYRYSNPQGLEMELRAHGLLAHESNYKEWGLSGLVKYQANSSGQGLWLSLQPAWGDTPSNVADRIWQPAAVTDYANDEDSNDSRGLQLNTELGYGLPGFFGRGLLTPYAGLNMTNDTQGYNIGARWAIDSRLNLDLIGEHKQTDDSIQLRVDLKF